MAQLLWDEAGEKFYEAGVSHGVFYPVDGIGVAWNGLASITEDADGGDNTGLYFDGNRYYNLVSSETFQGKLQAFTTPSEFLVCEGIRSLAQGLYVTQQPRLPFNLSYRTQIGDDISSVSAGYKIHLLYSCTVTSSAKTHQSNNDVPSPTTFEWDIFCAPPASDTFKPSAHFIIDSRNVEESTLSDLEDVLYGTPSTDPRFPTQGEVLTILSGVV